jgi:membrane fusion protein (multidrug efflux system)
MLLPRILPLATILLVAAAACDGANPKAQSAAPAGSPAQTPTETAQATPTAVPDWVVVTGKITARDRSDLVADTSGNVKAVMVERGTRVKKGDPLVRIDVRTAALNADEARANLISMESKRVQVATECARSTNLFEKGAITRSEWERDQAGCTQADQNVAAAQAKLALAGKSLDDGVLRAPFDGIVSNRWVSPGEWASPGSRLVTLVADGPRIAELRLSEYAASRVAAGAEVQVEPVALTDHVVSAHITRIGGEIDPATRDLVVEAELSPDDKILPGMFVRARITVAERTLPAIPATAVVKRGSTWRVFAVVDNALEERVVQLGPKASGGRVTILRGVSSGDLVAANVGDKTVDGVALR